MSAEAEGKSTLKIYTSPMMHFPLRNFFKVVSALLLFVPAIITLQRPLLQISFARGDPLKCLK